MSIDALLNPTDTANQGSISQDPSAEATQICTGSCTGSSARYRKIASATAETSATRHAVTSATRYTNPRWIPEETYLLRKILNEIQPRKKKGISKETWEQVSTELRKRTEHLGTLTRTDEGCRKRYAFINAKKKERTFKSQMSIAALLNPKSTTSVSSQDPTSATHVWRREEIQVLCNILEEMWPSKIRIPKEIWPLVGKEFRRRTEHLGTPIREDGGLRAGIYLLIDAEKKGDFRWPPLK